MIFFSSLRLASEPGRVIILTSLCLLTMSMVEQSFDSVFQFVPLLQNDANGVFPNDSIAVPNFQISL